VHLVHWQSALASVTLVLVLDAAVHSLSNMFQQEKAFKESYLAVLAPPDEIRFASAAAKVVHLLTFRQIVGGESHFVPIRKHDD
jgi:hypothetical protein